jgi:large exoprotein involved in heme utilization and adhesion
LLTINPSALLLNQITAQSIQSQARLEVAPGRSLVFVGSPITLSGSTLLALGGQVELASVASGIGIVGLTVNDTQVGLNLPLRVPLEDVSLNNGSEINVRAGGGGSITIAGQNVTLANTSILRAGIAANEGAVGSRAGDVNILATGNVRLTEGSFIANSTLGQGDSGDVNITAASVFLRDGAQVNSSTFGQGNGGTVNIQATGIVSFDGEDSQREPSGTYSRVNDTAIGNSGGIQIRAQSVSVTNGALLSANTLGQGNAGSITIVADDEVRFAGVGALERVASGAYSSVDVGAIGSSSGINITAASLAVENGAQLDASTYGNGNSGRITIQTPGAVQLGGELPAGVIDPGGIYSFVGQDGVGNSGGISLTAGSLSMVNGAALVATTFGQGNAGNVTIDVARSVVLDGQSPLFSSGIFSSVSPIAQGNGGAINLQAAALSVLNGGAIAASTLGRGNAANITIHVSDEAIFDGVGRDGFPSGIFSRVGARAIGDSGNIDLQAGTLSLTNGGQLQASTQGRGDAGDIHIQVVDRVQIAGVDPTTDQASGIFSSTGINSTGNGGDIRVDTGHLELQSGGVVSTQSQGSGRSGSIELNVRNSLTAVDSSISTSSSQSSGGNIAITARTMQLRGDSDITTSVFSGVGGGGNITLGARAIVALDDSDILAFSRDGRGGNITLNTPVFLAFRYRPAPFGTDPATLDGNDRVDVNASGRISSGVIKLPDVTLLQNSLAALPSNIIDTNALLATSCLARSARQGSFIITGAGGLPMRPDDLAIAPFPTYEIVPRNGEVGDGGGRGEREIGKKQLIEADGIYPLSDGMLVLGRSCY